MKTLLLAGAVALAALPAHANNFATNSPGVAQALGAGAPAAASNAHAHAAAAAISQSASHSRSTAAGGTGGSASVVNNNGGADGGSGGGAYAVPFSAPSLATTNACGGGISLGGFGVGGGGGGGALWELHDCRLRQAAVLLDARGDHAAARNVWCQISEVRTAYNQAGQPCPDDQPAVQPIAAAVPAPTDDVPAWCATTSGRDPNADREACLRALNANLAHLREMR